METLETISENAIVFQSVADLVIADLKHDYMPLVVSGVNDKDGCKVVNEARKHVRKLRTGLETERKKLKAKSLEYGRNVDGEAKRLSKPLAEIEEHLLTQEKIVTDEFARVKAAEQKAIEDKHKQQIVDLIKAGAVFDGKNYYWGSSNLTEPDIWILTDEEFQRTLDSIKEFKEIEDNKKAEAERLAKIEADKVAKEKEESDRLVKFQSEKQAKINEQKRKDQAEIEIQQKEAQAKIDADEKELDERQAKIEAAEKKIEDEKAETQRRKDLEAKIIKDAEEYKKKVEQDRLDKIEADARAEMLKPDKQKLREYLSKLLNTVEPILSTGDAVVFERNMSHQLIEFVNEKIGELEQL